MTAHDYILENWKNTIRIPGKDSTNSFIAMPKPYTTPCADSGFVNFFYWDTYFTNLGLLRDGLAEQAENNLDNIAFFIQKLGYMPNADHLVFRSQPPLFTRGVYDLYVFRKDKNIIRKYKDAILREFDFWNSDRMTSIGLNQYSAHEPKQGLNWYYEEFARRLIYKGEEKKLEKHKFTTELLGIAESGWDFNVRFMKKGNRFASSDFAHLDLNCILYDAEIKFAEMMGVIGEKELSDSYRGKANARKELINKYMRNKETGIYLDYDFVDGTFSEIVSAASLYPYAMGISDDKESLKKVLDLLMLPYGVSTAPYRGDDDYFQWDYPNMWPSNAYMAYESCVLVHLEEYEKKVKEMYLGTVDSVYRSTGYLWEKYNALQCAVSVSHEYDTPAMMGWTAGVYEYLLSKK